MTEIVAAYAAFVGCLVLTIWGVSLARRAIPELATEPRAIALHISAESIMGLTLVAGAAATFGGLPAGPFVVLIGFGMTLYSIVNSSGYYAERRQVAPLAMFAILFVATAAATAAALATVAA